MPHKAATSRQLTVADGPKHFVNPLPMRSIEFQSPLSPMIDDVHGQRIQTPADHDRPPTFPNRRQQFPQQHLQIAGQGTQLEIRRIGTKIATGQLGTVEITAQFLDAVLRGVAALIVKMHHLMFIPIRLQIQIGGQRTVHILAFLGAFNILIYKKIG